MIETTPAYLREPATGQVYAALHRAGQDSLEGVAGRKVAVVVQERTELAPDGLTSSGDDVFIEIGFEQPREVNHSIVLLAAAPDLARVFSLDLAGEDGELSAEALLSLGDVVSTVLDTSVGAMTWLQPAPRAWLANLEPVGGDGAGVARVELPAGMVDGRPLTLVTLLLSVDGAECAVRVAFDEEAEKAWLGLAPAEAPQAELQETPPMETAPAPAATPAATQPQPAAAHGAPAATPPSNSAPDVPVQAAQFRPLGPDHAAGRGSGIDLIKDVPLHVSVELGRASLTVREILSLGAGSVVELDRLAGEPVDVLVNDRLIARGEVVIVDESFGVRITELLREGAMRGIL